MACGEKVLLHEWKPSKPKAIDEKPVRLGLTFQVRLDLYFAHYCVVKNNWVIQLKYIE